MRLAWIGCVVIAMSVVAHAGVKKPGKDFWNILVTPNAKWVLKDATADTPETKASRVTIETYDVRTIGTAQVARLRWTLNDGEASAFGGGIQYPTQVAVTSAGLYLLDAAMDDTAVAAALTKKPARSSPPKPYKSTKRNGGRFLSVHKGEVCMGWRRVEGECEDVCESEVCFSSEGVTSITGIDAPGGVLMWEK